MLWVLRSRFRVLCFVCGLPSALPCCQCPLGLQLLQICLPSLLGFWVLASGCLVPLGCSGSSSNAFACSLCFALFMDTFLRCPQVALVGCQRGVLAVGRLAVGSRKCMYFRLPLRLLFSSPCPVLSPKTVMKRALNHVLGP